MLQQWKAPEEAMIPHFIIGGAMKSGTSTLHAMLDHHPHVFIPKEEIGFFDMDHIIEHFDFNFYDSRNKEWTFQDMETDPERAWKWYSALFDQGQGKILGEDSTSYLSTQFAAQRIAIQDKPIKMIFVLRQPSLRAYSNYHHLVRSGIAAHKFEDMLQYYPNSVLKRSMYKEQLEYYYKLLPKGNIKVILFEELVEDPKTCLQEVCNFLGLDFNLLPAEVLHTHANPARFPLFPRMHRLKNFFFRSYGNSFMLKSLPRKAPAVVISKAWWVKVVNRIHGTINPLVTRKTKPMRPETRRYLDTFFQKELKGLNELIGRDVLSRWFENK